MGNRVATIDIAKGISIILVVFGHSLLGQNNPDINDALGLFRMPLFFFLSGVFFNPSPAPGYFILKKADALLKPYFVTLIIIISTEIITRGGGGRIIWQAHDVFFEIGVGMLYGNGQTLPSIWAPMWFLTHLWTIFAVSMLFVKATKIDSFTTPLKITSIAILFIIGIKAININWQLPIDIFPEGIYKIGLPFSADLLPISMAFFISGYFLKRLAIDFLPNIWLLLLSTSVYFFIVKYTSADIDLNRRIFTNPIPLLLAAFSGIYLVLSLSWSLSKSKLCRQTLMTIGASSLFILIFHNYIQHKLYYQITGIEKIQPFHLVLSLLLGITIPLLIRTLANKNKILGYLYTPLSIKKSPITKIKDQNKQNKRSRT